MVISDIMALGGYYSSDLNDVEIVSLNSDVRTCAKPLPLPYDMYHHPVALIGGVVHACHQSYKYCYQLKGRTWTQMGFSLLNNRQYSGSFVMANWSWLIFGGSSSSTTSEVLDEGSSYFRTGPILPGSISLQAHCVVPINEWEMYTQAGKKAYLVDIESSLGHGTLSSRSPSRRGATTLAALSGGVTSWRSWWWAGAATRPPPSRTCWGAAPPAGRSGRASPGESGTCPRPPCTP